MCSVIILLRPGTDWPVLVAANRDEMRDRPWRPPARHWPDRAEVVAGLDELGGGTWLGLNDTGVISAVLNRRGTLGPEAGKRSRGELVLEALDHPDALAAVEALAELNPRAYRPFNMLIADDRDAYWIAHRDAAGARPVSVRPLAPGLSMVTGSDLNDRDDPRIRRFLPRFEALPAPDPVAGDWSGWADLLADRSHEPLAGPNGALCFELPNGFGTSSAALLALPSRARLPVGTLPVFRFAAGPPDRTPWHDVPL